MGNANYGNLGPRPSNMTLKVGNPRKLDLITTLKESNVDPSARIMVELIDIIIQETRELNDRISVNELGDNQGKIAILQELKRYITKGLDFTNI